LSEKDTTGSRALEIIESFGWLWEAKGRATSDFSSVINP